jgi:2-aminoadipate transaminase
MQSKSFDYARLLRRGLPPPAVKWTGSVRYNFTGGNNDADQVPVEDLIVAATTVLEREGRTLATYGLASGPQGHRRLREFLALKLKHDAGLLCSGEDILLTSGSLQALDLINGVLLEPGDTVIVEQETYGGALSRFNRLKVTAIGIPLDGEGLRIDLLDVALADLNAACGRNISTRSRPCRIRPARSWACNGVGSCWTSHNGMMSRSLKMIVMPILSGRAAVRPRSTE